MIKQIEVDFDLKDEVYLKGREEREIGHVVNIIVDIQGVMYTVTWVDALESSRHYSFELTRKFQRRWRKEEDEAIDSEPD